MVLRAMLFVAWVLQTGLLFYVLHTRGEARGLVCVREAGDSRVRLYILKHDKNNEGVVAK